MKARPQARRPRERAAAPVRRLLDLLSRGATLVESEEGEFVLEDAARAAKEFVDKSLVRACIAGDLLGCTDHGIVLSDTGHAWLRRAAADGREPFRAQHQRRALRSCEANGVQQTVLLNEGESPLGWLRSRKDRAGRPLIGPEQFEAGERLRADYWFAQMSSRVTANWAAAAPPSRSRRGAPADAASLRDEVLAAKDRVMRALAAVGPEISGILIDICCELKGLEEAEKENGWPQRSGKVVLQIALTRLAKHYGLIGESRKSRGKLRHWGNSDYRPRIGGTPEEQEGPQ